jgi:hypothetical protein
MESAMKAFAVSVFCAASLIAASLIGAMTAAPVHAAGLKDQLVGTWALVSNTEEYADGSKVLWGPDTKGSLIFSANGQYSLQIAVGERVPAKGNPAENPVGKFISYFGTYAASDADKTLSFRIVRASFPSWDGTEQKRLIVETGDQLIYKAVTPIPSAKGPFVPVLIWQRVK